LLLSFEAKMTCPKCSRPKPTGICTQCVADHAIELANEMSGVMTPILQRENSRNDVEATFAYTLAMGSLYYVDAITLAMVLDQDVERTIEQARQTSALIASKMMQTHLFRVTDPEKREAATTLLGHVMRLARDKVEEEPKKMTLEEALKEVIRKASQ
jgi:hypothetical protein